MSKRDFAIIRFSVVGIVTDTIQNTAPVRYLVAIVTRLGSSNASQGATLLVAVVIPTEPVLRALRITII